MEGRRDRARGDPTLAVPDYQGHGGPVCVAEFGVRSEISVHRIERRWGRVRYARLRRPEERLFRGRLNAC